MLILNNEDVSKVLNMPLRLSALDSVFRELACGDAVGMGRIDLYVPSKVETAPYYRWAVMTGGSKRNGLVCARMLSDMVAWPTEFSRVRENKYAKAPGTFCGLLFLFSAHDATPVAMINDGIVQHIRVGGGAGLGVKYLSRRDSETVGMIGSGGMARTYLDAFCQVRKIKRAKVFSPNRKHVEDYAEEVSKRHGIKVEPSPSAREAVRGTEQAFYGRAGFLGYVAGDARERGLVPHVDLPAEILDMPTLIDVVAGRFGGRSSDAQTSFFLNVGAIGAQFEGVAAAVYHKAREQGLGREIPTEWFLQDVRD